MIYTTGTIAVSGNTLTGTGTNFTAAGSLIRNGCTVIAMTSPVQVFQITAIGGATSLTVTPAANPAIPAGTKYAILLSDSLSVDGLAQDIAETFTMYQRYMSGFADVMNGTTDVTITINGVAVTVPGQKSLAKKGANSDITSLSGLTTALSIEQGGTGSTTASGARTNLGLGNSATRDVGTAAGTVAAGNDNRLNTLEGKTGGGITGAVIAKRTSDSNPASGGELESVLQNSGGAALSQFHMFTQMAGNTRYGFLRVWDTSTFKDWYFDHSSGNAYAAAAWVNNSDRRIKDNLTPIEDVLEKMKKIRGYTWVRKDDQMKGSFGIGFVAQEVQEVFPEAVSHAREGSLTVEGQVIEQPLALSPGDVAAALHHEAILELMEEITELKQQVSSLSSQR
ncbi:chaperone of endosialidase family protein [Enterobacter roggenkampii]|uniref:tail fiber domain-containing protein n=1 Tax=Enterobacter roggenkampii TaxID=1812935 RepID=UPI000D026892|nr:tail fiber domain-containing protein [Enterobacter roggenkampii]PRW42424.1 chaperone of endosialidase family protein [Enterobacter roggenkampii]QLV14762.1 tail fiber domain-containing protein [Enterobacter roggenkampii]